MEWLSKSRELSIKAEPTGDGGRRGIEDIKRIEWNDFLSREISSNNPLFFRINIILEDNRMGKYFQ